MFRFTTKPKMGRSIVNALKNAILTGKTYKMYGITVYQTKPKKKEKP